MTENIVYVSRVRVEQVNGPLRFAYLPSETKPVLLGVHSELASYYKVDLAEHEPHASTFDYLVASVAGWLLATFSGALEARGISTNDGRLIAQAAGEVEQDGKVLILRRIHLNYTLRLDSAKREAAERMHSRHAEFCPVARTVSPAVAISTMLEMQDA